MPSLQPAFEGAVPSSDIPATEQASSVATTGHSVVVNDSVSTSPLAVTNSGAESRARPIVSQLNAASAAPVTPPGGLYPPATLKGIDADGSIATEWDDSMGSADMVLELADGLALAGHSFGANKSVAGECVFQTG